MSHEWRTEAMDEIRRLEAINADLLAALEEVAGLYDGPKYRWPRGVFLARAAIAQAKGES